MLSEAADDYLKNIYHLQAEGPATTKDIASALGVSAASVTNMIKRLAQWGLVKHVSYRGVTLTEKGEKAALEVVRHHRLLELFLTQIMGFSWDDVHAEAHHLEHHISEEFEERMFQMLGCPTHDPHGDPIPTRDGRLPDRLLTPLAHGEPGQELIIHQVAHDNPELLRYLDEIGVGLHMEVQVLAKTPIDGLLTVKSGTAEHILGPEVARHIFVAPVETETR